MELPVFGGFFGHFGPKYSGIVPQTSQIYYDSFTTTVVITLKQYFYVTNKQIYKHIGPTLTYATLMVLALDNTFTGKFNLQPHNVSVYLHYLSSVLYGE